MERFIEKIDLFKKGGPKMFPLETLRPIINGGHLGVSETPGYATMNQEPP